MTTVNNFIDKISNEQTALLPAVEFRGEIRIVDRQFQKYYHAADHLRYHKNHKSADQHLKCFHPLRLLYEVRKNRRCQ